MPNLLALAVETGVEQMFDHIEGDGPMWNGTGRRSVSVPIRFHARFAAAPAVQLSVGMIDVDTGPNLRLDLTAKGITPDGFTAVASTWGDTRLGRLRVHWIAIGNRPHQSMPEWNV